MLQCVAVCCSVLQCVDVLYVVLGSGDKRAKLWDVNTGTCVRTFGDEEGPKDGVTSVAVSPDSRYIAAGSLDRVVRSPSLASLLQSVAVCWSQAP